MTDTTIAGVAVIGAGTMGAGIAQVLCGAGHRTVLVDQSEEQLTEARERIQDSLEELHGKDKIAETPETVLERLETTTDMAAVADADLIIEAVPEKTEVKHAVYQEAAEHNVDAIYASNTSSISISTLAEAAPSRERFLGLHFFNPVPVMDIVEVVRTDETDEDVLDTCTALVEELGKEYGIVRDSPGFASNRVLMPFINEAIRALDEGVAAKEDMDTIARKGFNHPMGPLQLADFIGLDVCLDIMERMHEQSGTDRFRPAQLLQEKVEAGQLGRKSGEGFYTYD